MTPGRVVAVAALVAAAHGTARAAEADSPLIALVVQEPNARWVARLSAEIRGIGFDVTTLVAPSSGRDAAAATRALEEAARDAGAIAAIRLLRTRDGIEVWIADRVTDKTVMRRVLSPASETPDDAVLALRAVELLRGSLVELRRVAPPRGAVAPPAEVRALVAADLDVAPGATRIGLFVAPGVLSSPGGVGSALNVQLGALVVPWRAWAVEAWVGLPARSANVEADSARARVDVTLAGLGARWSSAPFGSSPFALTAAGGVGAVWLRLSGERPAGGALSPRTDDVVAATAYGRVGVACALTRWLQIGAHVGAGAALPWPAVDFAGTRVADWGLPFVLGSLAVEAALP